MDIMIDDFPVKFAWVINIFKLVFKLFKFTIRGHKVNRSSYKNFSGDWDIILLEMKNEGLCERYSSKKLHSLRSQTPHSCRYLAGFRMALGHIFVSR